MAVSQCVPLRLLPPWSARRVLPGVLGAEVALLSETATARLDGAAVTPEQAVDAIEACGFEARVVSSSQEGGGGGSSRGVETLRLDVQGMHCSACSSGGEGVLLLRLLQNAFWCSWCNSVLACLCAAATEWYRLLGLLHASVAAATCLQSVLPLRPPAAAAVEAALQLVPGVRSAAVSLTVQQAEVRYAASAGGKAFEQSLVDAVEGCGFEATGACVGSWRHFTDICLGVVGPAVTVEGCGFEATGASCVNLALPLA